MTSTSDQRTYTVTGMTCSHCVASVREEVSEVAGVVSVDVDLSVRAPGRHRQRARRHGRADGGQRSGLRGRRMNSIPRQLATLRGRPRGPLHGRLHRRPVHRRRTPRRRRHDPRATENEHDQRRDTRAADTAPRRSPTRVRGLAVADNGLQLELADAELERGRSEELRFRIVDARGAGRPRLRRRTREADAPDRRAPRPHRLPAPASDDGRGRNLVDAAAARGRRLLPSVRRLRPRRRGHDARRRPTRRRHAPTSAAARAGADGRQRRRLRRPARRRRRPPGPRERAVASPITKDGAPVKTEPYLGAGGHLVALREGDLAFLHVHPTDQRLGRVRARPSRPPAATACSCSSSTRAASRPPPSRRRSSNAMNPIYREWAAATGAAGCGP